MPEIALNILDIAENSVRADASLIGITVSVQPEEDTLTVSIKDDGCGMTPEEMDTLFTPFSSHKADGTGLGLAITQKIIKAHYGSIDVSSSPGRGTVFTVTLPHL